MFTIIYSRRSLKDLEKAPQNIQRRIYVTVESIAENPFKGKKLSGELDGMYSVRVWPYRIIYSIDKKAIIVTIISVGHRQGVYE